MVTCFVATRKVSRATAGRRLIMKPLQLDSKLAAFMKMKTAPRSLVTKHVWAYAKRHNLQRGATIQNKEGLKPLFQGKSVIRFGDVARMIKKHSR